MANQDTEIIENSKLKVNESESTERIFLSDKKSGYNIGGIILSSMMLIGPLLMGISIASIGNNEYIRIHFYKMHIDSTEPKDGKKVNGSWFPATIWSIGFVFPFGGWFGSIIGAITIDKWGRKIPSQIFCLIGIIGAIMKITCRYIHIALFFLSRFLDGISASGLMVAGLLLMFETLPQKLEKYYKPMIQISVNLGILIIGCFSLYSLVQVNWNFVHIITLVLSTMLLIAVTMLGESPKYVYNSSKDEVLTEKILKNLRGKYYDFNELENLKKSVEESSSLKRMSIIEFIKTKRFRFATLSLIVLHLGQQLSGINSIMAFAPTLLEGSGFKMPDVLGVIITSIGLLGSIIFAPFVERFKRKLLWLIGFFFMFISFVGFSISQSYENSPAALKLFFLGLFVLMFQIGPGPVVWFISVEMFPTRATGAAQGVAGFFNWFASTLVYLLFPILEKEYKYKVLRIFIVFQLIVIIYSFLFVVETFDRNAEDVLDDYEKKGIFK